MEEPQHKAEKRCPERSGLRVSFLPPCSAFPAFPLGVLSSIICWQTLTNVWLSIQCHWNRMSWSCLRILFLLLLLHLFFFSFKTLYMKPLEHILLACWFTSGPSSNYPISCAKEIYIFSDAFSSHSVMHCSTLKLWEGHGKLQSITIVFWPVILIRLQIHKGEKSHPAQLRKVPYGEFFHTHLGL